MNIYLIPGLGADKRMYSNQLRVLPGAVVIEHLNAIKGESLTRYSRRMAEKLDLTSPFVLIGASLGGMVAMELSRITSPEKIILLSSVKARNEMPLFIRSMKYLNLHRLISGRGYKRFNKLMVKRLDSRGDSPVAKLIKDMTDDVPAEFIEWAINAVINWNPPAKYRSDIVHIHGTSDQLFPFSKVKNAIAIKNGSHVMNMTRSRDVNDAILKSLGLEKLGG